MQLGEGILTPNEIEIMGRDVLKDLGPEAVRQATASGSIPRSSIEANPMTFEGECVDPDRASDVLDLLLAPVLEPNAELTLNLLVGPPGNPDASGISQRFDPRARYDVTAADGSKVGEIQKVFGTSLLRSTYRLYDARGQEAATATEQSLGVALIRRAVGFVPYLDNVADWLPIPYHFTFESDGRVLGSHRRHIGKIRDTYTIDLSGDPERSLDRRLVLAIAVGMDALQAR